MNKILILTICTFLLISCNQKSKDNEKKTNDIENTKAESIDNQTVLLSAEPRIVKLSELPDSIKVIMTNNTPGTITTGLHYSIEKLDDTEWNVISPKDIVFNDLGWTLKPTDSESFENKLYKNQINYTAGKYRIVKHYLKSDYQKTKQDFNVYAEFDVENK